MNWDNLKIFLTVARAGSATAASKQLGVNHATVIRRLDQLEKKLAVRLFDRLKTGYRITNHGREVVKLAESMEVAANQIELRLKGKETLPAGKLTVSRPEQSLLDMSELFSKFLNEFPQIELEIITTPQISNLDRLEADVAIRLTNTPPELLVGRELGKMQFGVYGSKQYLAQFKSNPEPEDCKWLLWTGVESSQVPEAQHPDEVVLNMIPGAIVAMRSNSVEDILMAIKSGMGVGFLSKTVASKTSGITELCFDKQFQYAGITSTGLWLLTRRELRYSKRVKVFMEFCQKHLSF